MVLDIQNENGISKITNLLGSISDKVLKNEWKFMINLVMQIIDTNQANR